MALEKESAAAAPNAKKSKQNASTQQRNVRSKTARPPTIEDVEETPDFYDADDAKSQKPKEATQLLQKRKKYDPRAAIKEAKKKEENGGKKFKSAFPEGMLKSKKSSEANLAVTPRNFDET